MNCLMFDRALDALPEAPLTAEAHAHAAGCVRCAAALRRAQALESALRAHLALDAPLPPLRADFAAAVLARVPVRSARTAVTSLPSPWPWWAEAIWQPATVLALTVFAAWFLAGARIVAALQHAPAFLPAGVTSLTAALGALGLRLAPAGLSAPAQAAVAIVVIACVLLPPAWLAGGALQRAIADGFAAPTPGALRRMPAGTTRP